MHLIMMIHKLNKIDFAMCTFWTKNQLVVQPSMINIYFDLLQEIAQRDKHLERSSPKRHAALRGYHSSPRHAQVYLPDSHPHDFVSRFTV